MRRVLAALWLACCCCTLNAAEEPDPRQVLKEARDLARQGKYEEALQKHLWFHENALKHRPSLSGVRLSFALSDWIKLGEKYPKAKEALVALRDKNSKAISGGNGSFELFQELIAINRHLGETQETVELFKTLHDKQPDLAKKCYHVAEKDLAAQGEYKLCSSYIADPVVEFDSIKEMRELSLKFAKNDNPRLREYPEKSFVERTRRLIEILVGAGRVPDAENVRERALAVCDDHAIRQAVEEAVERQKK